MNQELLHVLCLVQSYFGVWFLKPEDKWRLFSFFDHFSSQIRSVSQTLKCDVFNQSLNHILQKKSGLFLSDNISFLYMETFCNQIWLFELEKAQLENFLSVPEVCLFLNKISYTPWPCKLRRRRDTSFWTKVDSVYELPYITRDVSYHIVGATPLVDSGPSNLLIRWPTLLIRWPTLLFRDPLCWFGFPLC